MTYHLDWTVFLFAHTISEVLDLLAFVLIFVGGHARRDGEPARCGRPGVMARRGVGRRRYCSAAAWLLAGCAAASSAEPVATDQVDLPPSYRFEPEAITVPDGTKVTWTNNDNFTHNVRLLDDGGETMTVAPG